MTDPNDLSALVARAKTGEATALDAVVRQITPRVYHLALRMLADPEAARDAAQEILIRVVTKLSTFEGQSRFETWVYRVGTKYLLTAQKVRARDPGLTFDLFAEDLMQGLVDDTAALAEDHVLVTEVRIACTMAMLLCLNPPLRAAYVLGDVLELDQTESAAALGITKANYRQRLTRARAAVTDFTARSCGLANDAAPCRCPRRVPAALAAGRIDGAQLLAPDDAPDFAAVRRQAQALAGALQAAKLQTATGTLRTPAALAESVLRILDPPT